MQEKREFVLVAVFPAYVFSLLTPLAISQHTHPKVDNSLNTISFPTVHLMHIVL